MLLRYITNVYKGFFAISYQYRNYSKKPRLPQKAIWHKERYDTNLEGLIKEYDQTISNYMDKRTNGKETRGWSQEISSFYNHIYYLEVRRMLEQQGFGFK